ncbi:MAG TPA: hypothetical protein VD814_02935 [Nocardioides sp.]|nr:hypothetical protein [Nocardioides sp.]
MSNIFATDVEADALQATPRVRHLAREALALMAFSALASTTVAACLLLLTNLGHQG